MKFHKFGFITMILIILIWVIELILPTYDNLAYELLDGLKIYLATIFGFMIGISPTILKKNANHNKKR